jgi:hypothetical protein
MTLELCPLTLREARSYVAARHQEVDLFGNEATSRWGRRLA